MTRSLLSILRKSDLDRVCKYIFNLRITFADDYNLMLKYYQGMRLNNLK